MFNSSALENVIISTFEHYNKSFLTCRASEKNKIVFIFFCIIPPKSYFRLPQFQLPPRNVVLFKETVDCGPVTDQTLEPLN